MGVALPSLQHRKGPACPAHFHKIARPHGLPGNHGGALMAKGGWLEGLWPDTAPEPSPGSPKRAAQEPSCVRPPKKLLVPRLSSRSPFWLLWPSLVPSMTPSQNARLGWDGWPRTFPPSSLPTPSRVGGCKRTAGCL